MNGRLMEPDIDFETARVSERLLETGWLDAEPEASPSAIASPSFAGAVDAASAAEALVAAEALGAAEAKGAAEGVEEIALPLVGNGKCWEDADVILEGLDIRPGDYCLSAGSSGDGALAMLLKDPAQVVAVDPNPAQLYCLELKAAAYLRLTHDEFLALMGARDSSERLRLYEECRSALSEDAALFWDATSDLLFRHGLAGAGRFERKLRLFRRLILPLCHGRKRAEELFKPKDELGRKRFFLFRWRNLRWRLLFALLLSRFGLKRFASGFSGAERTSLLGIYKDRVERILCGLPPSENPHLRWLLTGKFGDALPAAWRKDNFEAIRENLPRLLCFAGTIEDYCAEAKKEGLRFQRYNLGDAPDALSEEDSLAMMRAVLGTATPGARLLYWSVRAPGSQTQELYGSLRPLDKISDRLGDLDKTLFRGLLVIEEVL